MDALTIAEIPRHILISVFIGACCLLAVLVHKAVALWLEAYASLEEFRQAALKAIRPILSRAGPRDSVERQELQVRLVQAGLRGNAASRTYLQVRIFSFLASCALATFLYLTMGEDSTAFLLAVAALGGGLYYPEVWLNGRIDRRRGRIARVLAGTIDLVVLCLEAGLSVEKSFERVADEIFGVEPLLAEELQLMLGEVSAGLPFPQALKRMAERVGLSELVLLARLISQGTVMGASVARTLREYSEASYARRMLGLEERAGKVSAQTTLPVIVLLLAALGMVVGPAVVMIFDSLRTF